MQIATNKGHTVDELLELLSRELKQSLNLHIDFKHKDRSIGDVRKNHSNTIRAKYLLGWKPSFSLSVGITLTISWFVHKNNLSTEFADYTDYHA